MSEKEMAVYVLTDSLMFNIEGGGLARQRHVHIHLFCLSITTSVSQIPYFQLTVDKCFMLPTKGNKFSLTPLC